MSLAAFPSPSPSSSSSSPAAPAGWRETGAQISLSCSISFETAAGAQAGAEPQCFEFGLGSEAMLMLLSDTLGFKAPENPADAACAAHCCDDFLKELIEKRLRSHGWRASLAYPLYESCLADFRLRVARFAENPAAGLALRYSFCAREDPYSRQDPDPKRSAAEIKILLLGLCNPPKPAKGALKLLPKRGASLGLAGPGGQTFFVPLLRADFARLARKCPALLLLRQHEQHALIAAQAPFARLGARPSSYAWNPFSNAGAGAEDKRLASEFFPSCAFAVRETDPGRLAQALKQTFGRVPQLDLLPPGLDPLCYAGEEILRHARLHLLSLEAQNEARKLIAASPKPGACPSGAPDKTKPKRGL